MNQRMALVRYRSAPSRLLASFAQSVLEQEELLTVAESTPLWPPPLPPAPIPPPPPPPQIFSDTHPSKPTTDASGIPKRSLELGAYDLLETCLEHSPDAQHVGSRWRYDEQRETLPPRTNQAQNPAPILRASSLPTPARPRAVAETATSPYLGPYQSRAKRGCATHPRSVAERVRRTRISEKIRKLQELVPNMDKQLNTAEMLDEAVEYVKFLQQQVKELSGSGSCGGCSGGCQQNESSREMQS